MPTEMVMVGKSLMTVEGIGKEIYPDLDVFAEARPFFMKLLAQRYSPMRLAQDALKVLSRLGSAAQDMPAQIQEILEDLRKGRLRIEAHDGKLTRATDRLGRRIFSAVVFGGLLWAGVTFELAGRRPLATAFGAGAAALLVLHWWKDRGK
jgi:ubiquinone biosynthesis protein